MTVKIQKTKISYLDQELSTLIFLPSIDSTPAKAFAVFTHGYSSHKASILSWATKLAEEGVATVIFDQPGHYLGTFSEVENFDDYKEHAYKLFKSAYNVLHDSFIEEFPLIDEDAENGHYKVILGGHSLGALLSLLSTESEDFKDFDTITICVGLGMPPEGVTHMFDTPFYKSTLDIRRQLVSSGISPDQVFPWIKKRKKELILKDKRLHFITGADDVIVGEHGTQILVDDLSENNQVSYNRPAKLAHHLPDLAASYIKKFLKSEGII